MGVLSVVLLTVDVPFFTVTSGLHELPAGVAVALFSSSLLISANRLSESTAVLLIHPVGPRLFGDINHVSPHVFFKLWIKNTLWKGRNWIKISKNPKFVLSLLSDFPLLNNGSL